MNNVEHDWNPYQSLGMFAVGLGVNLYFRLLNHFSVNSPLPEFIFPKKEGSETDIVLSVVGLGMTLLVAVYIEGRAQRYDSDMHALHQLLRLSGVITLMLCGWNAPQMFVSLGVVQATALGLLLLASSHVLIMLSESHEWLARELEDVRGRLQASKEKKAELDEWSKNPPINHAEENAMTASLYVLALCTTRLAERLAVLLGASAVSLSRMVWIFAICLASCGVVQYSWRSLVRLPDALSNEERLSLCGDAGCALLVGFVCNISGMLIASGWNDSWLALLLCIPYLALMIAVVYFAYVKHPQTSLDLRKKSMSRKCERLDARQKVLKKLVNVDAPTSS